MTYPTGVPPHLTIHHPATQPRGHAKRDPFLILSDADLDDLPEPSWLVEGVLPANGMSAIVAPPASGKTFVALDLALHIAAGAAWNGRKSKMSDVIYLAAEGQFGLQKRVRAWKRAHSYLDLDLIHFIPEPVQLLDAQDVTRLLDTITEYDIEPGLIVFDTFARCFLGGDENSASSMGQAIESVRRIQTATNGAVLLVHHTRKGDAVERGSSALRGALDSMISMRKDGPLVSLSCAKMKDSIEFPDIHLRLTPTESSCVLEVAAPSEGVSALDGGARAALELLSAGLRHGQWKAAATAAGISSSSFARARKELVDAGLVTKGPDGTYSRTEVTESDGTTSTRSFKTGTVEPPNEPAITPSF